MLSEMSWKAEANYWKVFCFAPDGMRRLPEKMQPSNRHGPRSIRFTWTLEQYRKLADGLRLKGRPPIDRDAIQDFAKMAECPYAEAALVWCGFPEFQQHAADFLPKNLRAELGLKVAEAKLARERLKSLENRLDVFSVHFGQVDAALLWQPKALAAPFAHAWTLTMGRQAGIPLSVSVVADSILKSNIKLAKLKEIVDCPEKYPGLYNPTPPEFRVSSIPGFKWVSIEQSGSSSDSEVNLEKLLSSGLAAAQFLFHELPVGATMRTVPSRLFDLIQQNMIREDRLIKLAHVIPFEKKRVVQADDLITRFESPVNTIKTPNGEIKVRDDGALIVIWADSVLFAYRPSKPLSEKQRFMKNEIQRVFCEPTEVVPAPRVAHGPDGKRTVYERFRRRMEDSPVPEGGWEYNPLLSAAHLLPEVRRRLGLSEPGAASYLQMLTLQHPTQENVRKWNGWSAQTYDECMRELKEANLAIKAERGRAGRSHFLPGGWEDLKSPHLPIESWKFPLFQLSRDADGNLIVPLGCILPLIPVHELFESAWQRVLNGDEPRYEEVS